MTFSLSVTDAQLPNPLPTGLGRYTDRREMARGGNGILQAAYDQVVGRTVALKFLLPQHRSDTVHRRRLLREARVTAQLQHPGTVAVYDIGHDIEVGVFYSMKRISGENFFDVLRGIAKREAGYREAFPLRRRIEIIRNVCMTLAYAHARGIVHRDVKPANIWVGNFGEVTLLDWGAAKVWGQSSLLDRSAPGTSRARRPTVSESSHDPVIHRDDGPVAEVRSLTASHELIGTPTYMSPEQIECEAVDDRSDVFAAGICLYEAMAIREPFRGADQEETFDNICQRQPTPPSERAPDEGIPRRADQAFARAVAKQPAARYQSMRQLIDELDLLMSDLPA